HLVRNSIDHGLEMPNERRAAGKDDTGTLTLTAAHQGGHIVIELHDDGRGLDRARILRKAAERGLPIADNASDGQVWDLIFQPGFSTAEQVTNLSGRGVGMDVVKTNLGRIGGSVEVATTPGKGTTYTLKIPLTLAIIPALLVTSGAQRYAIPQVNLIELVRASVSGIFSV